MPKSRFKKKTFIVWIIIVVILLTIYFIHKDWFDIVFLEKFVKDNKLAVVFIYILILSLLGLTFIPSTPFAIAGVFIFSPTEAYLYNLVGILTSSTIVYHYARFLKIDSALKNQYPEKLKKAKQALNKKELPIIIAWSFFPFVPTDLIIYAASSLKVKLYKCLLGVLIGEGILNIFYIFSVGLAV